MALKLGAYTACLHDRPLGEALDVLKANGLTSVEVNTSGFIPSPHCPVDALLASEQARAAYLEDFSSRGMVALAELGARVPLAVLGWRPPALWPPSWTGSTAAAWSRRSRSYPRARP